MPSIGPTELIIVAVIAIFIFGPSKLPELGRSLGKGLREFKSAKDEITGEISSLKKSVDFTAEIDLDLAKKKA